MVNQTPNLDGVASREAVQLKKAFLSHSSADAEIARKLCALLEERGFPCWIAPRDMKPGELYPVGCMRGIVEAESMILLLSETALASNQVKSEVEQAHKRAKPIYTVLIPPAKVRGEMDFYLSRLHWIQSSGRTVESIAGSLAAVLGQTREWEEVAAPPTLRRTLLYRPVAFAKLITASLVGMMLLLAVTVFALNQMLNLDFRRLGYVNLSAEPAQNGHAIQAHAQVWVMAQGVRFQDVRLLVASGSNDKKDAQQAFTNWAIPEQMGSMQEAAIPLDSSVHQVTTCLIVPSPRMLAPYRVTQQFAIKPQSDGILVAETSQERVSREDGSPCGAKP